MRYSIFFALAAASVSTAFTFGAGSVDGVYVMKPGATEPELIAEHNNTAPAVKRDLPISGHKCDTSYTLDGVNYQQAKSNLEVVVNKQEIPSHSGLVANVGSAQVYTCSWGGVNPSSTHEIEDLMTYLDGKCGKLEGGYVLEGDWAKGAGRGLVGAWPCPDGSY